MCGPCSRTLNTQRDIHRFEDELCTRSPCWDWVTTVLGRFIPRTHSLPTGKNIRALHLGRATGGCAITKGKKKGVFSMMRSQASRPCSTAPFVYMHRHLMTASIDHGSVGVPYQTLLRVQETLAEYRRVSRLRGSKMSPQALEILDRWSVMCCSPTMCAHSHLYTPPSV